MSVFTVVAADTLRDWLIQYDLRLVAFEGITSGITNTNYFVDTTNGRFVLTLFETLKLNELPFYLELMCHLAQQGVACPMPLRNRQQQLASILAERAACLVTCLTGQDVTSPTQTQCHAVGNMLATLHGATTDFKLTMPNPRGAAWRTQTAAMLYPLINTTDAAILREELHYQAQQCFAHLPHGVIHADLFKDNVLMHGDTVTGFIDFYYACHDVLIYDVAIAVNDWARKPNGEIDAHLAHALLQGYQSIRPFASEEVAAWPALLRAAALRFWLSRLQDLHRPTPGALTYTKDPTDFRTLLLAHRTRSNYWTIPQSR